MKLMIIDFFDHQGKGAIMCGVFSLQYDIIWSSTEEKGPNGINLFMNKSIIKGY